jgi:hypothetical protein
MPDMDDWLKFQHSALARRMNEANQRLHRIGRLKWLLEDFLRQRPSERREGEFSDLQVDVLAYAGTWGDPDYQQAKLLPAAELDALYEEVRAGIALLSQRERWTPNLGPVAYGVAPERDAAERAKLQELQHQQQRPLDEPVRPRRLLPLRRVYRLTEPTTARLFLNAVLTDFEISGARVAQCLRCGKLFDRERRQAFCSIQCAQHVRDDRRRKDSGVSIEALPGHAPFIGLEASAQTPRRRSRKRSKRH